MFRDMPDRERPGNFASGRCHPQPPPPAPA